MQITDPGAFEDFLHGKKNSYMRTVIIKPNGEIVVPDDEEFEEVSRRLNTKPGNMTIYTKGYEQQDIDEFIKQLQQSGVTMLVDVREIPISRKRGFSKTSLSEHLSRNGIKYVHLRELGCPTPIRRKLQETGDYDSCFQMHREYLRQNPLELMKLKGLARHWTACLMCFEKDPLRCHRSVIVDELLRAGGVEARHL